MSPIEHDHGALGAYVLGALSADDASAVDAHLGECADCRRELAELAELRDALSSVPPEASSIARLMATYSCAQHNESKPGRAQLRVAAASVVIVLAAFGGGVLLGRQSAPDGETPTPQSGLRAATPRRRRAP